MASDCGVMLPRLIRGTPRSFDESGRSLRGSSRKVWLPPLQWMSAASALRMDADFFLACAERARLQAEARAAEDLRLQVEARAAAEAKRKRELEREAARQALLKVRPPVAGGNADAWWWWWWWFTLADR